MTERRLGPPPTPARQRANVSAAPVKKTKDLSFKIDPKVHQEMKITAAEMEMTMTDMLLQMWAEFKERHPRS
ncbi:MAG: hypothetical protein DHS20C03_02680 [Minwuia thermotolerans]|nr:MAG: hypothetical protein DHS20C03_02680 [Minwuia thermotolerans]